MAELILPHQFPFSDPHLPYQIELMQLSDLDQVMEIEHAAFPAPWPASAYRYDLTQNDLSTYLVLRRLQPDEQKPTLPRLLRRKPSPLLGHGGLWLMVDEGHISTIAVHPDWRGRGLGELVLVALIDVALLRGATQITLEVRVSNHVAQSLYRKHDFQEVGLRKRYYHDNNEDALIMTTPPTDEAAFQAAHAASKSALYGRLQGTP